MSPLPGWIPIRSTKSARLSESSAGEKTILLSTHILQEVEAMASRAIFIDAGRVVYDGPIENLTRGGKRLEQSFRELTGAGERAVMSSPAGEPQAEMKS